jgi:hypothetical protein
VERSSDTSNKTITRLDLDTFGLASVFLTPGKGDFEHPVSEGRCSFESGSSHNDSLATPEWWRVLRPRSTKITSVAPPESFD